MRLERKRLHLSQEEMAKRLGVHRLTQINYELDRTEPDAAYFEALKKTGADDVYVKTGHKSSRNDVLAGTSERLLMALCEELKIPFGKVQEAIAASSTAQDSYEDGKQAQMLLRYSQVVNTKNKVLRLDKDLLVDIIEGLDRQFLALGKQVTPLRRAHVIASLYREFSEKGEIDSEFLKSAAKSMA